MASCPLCSAAVRERLRLPHASVYRCLAPACRLEFASPQLADEALAAAYRRLYYPADGGKKPVLENTSRDVTVQALQGVSQRVGPVSGMQLLDYGCGRGEFSRIAREFGLVPVGIEQDPEARRQIERQSLFPVYPTLESLEQQEGHNRFDLIILWQVIEHLRRPWDELTRLRGLLAKNGWLVAATPNAEGLKARTLGSRWDNYANPTHFYYFSRQSLRRVFERSGLSPVEEWRFKMVYPGHGPLRLGLHALLAATRLDSDLFFAGGSRLDAESEKGTKATLAAES